MADNPNPGNNTQAGDTLWAGQFMGMDEKILSMEGCINEGGTLNIPWLVGLMTSQGNGLTSAIARNCVVFCDPEWGFEATGAGSAGGYQGMGASSGGLSVSW